MQKLQCIPHNWFQSSFSGNVFLASYISLRHHFFLSFLIAMLPVANPGCLSQIRIFFIPDPGLRVKKIPDPGSESASKNLSIFNPKIVSKLSEKWSGMFIPDADPVSGSWFFTHPGYRIPDPGFKKTPDPGSGSATLRLIVNIINLAKRSAESYCVGPALRIYSVLIFNRENLLFSRYLSPFATCSWRRSSGQRRRGQRASWRRSSPFFSGQIFRSINQSTLLINQSTHLINQSTQLINHNNQLINQYTQSIINTLS